MLIHTQLTKLIWVYNDIMHAHGREFKQHYGSYGVKVLSLSTLSSGYTQLPSPEATTVINVFVAFQRFSRTHVF